MSDIKETFTNIYDKYIWGIGESGQPYYSGSGSHDSSVINPYIDLVCEIIKKKKISTILDVGCGDFNIMSSVLQKSKYEKYYGLDVVDGLIQYNNEKYGSDKIEFLCIDASDTSQSLPDADIMIIRQVLQHLDNEHISTILERSQKYKYVLVTEHIPIIPWGGFNKEKPINNEIRLKQKSGIYIERKPFKYKCEHLLYIKAGNKSRIRTSLISN